MTGRLFELEAQKSFAVAMGKLNLTALRVRQTALAQKACGKTNKTPVWADVVADIPPASILVRNVRQGHPLVRQRVKTDPKTKKPEVVFSARSRKIRRMFQPVNIRYEEDELRKTFFRDHPWELARPRVVLENDGKDHTRYDWSKLQQPGKKVDGERSVDSSVYHLSPLHARFQRLALLTNETTASYNVNYTS